MSARIKRGVFRNTGLRKKVETLKNGENVELGSQGCGTRPNNRRSWKAKETGSNVGRKQTTNKS